MDFRIIKSPSEGTKDILKRRMSISSKADISNIGAIGLIQGKLIEMIYAADIAEKTVGVVVEDIKGNCPQHMILLAILGDIASVEAAMDEIKLKMKEGKA